MAVSPADDRQIGGRESARQSAPAAPPRLELRGVSKSFGGVHVLEDIDFRLGASEVVGLLGDNGAGKSTLIKIITGVHQPDHGEILFGGEPVQGLTVEKARDLGVETVYQERALADQQPLWRNIFMGRPLTYRLGFLRVGEMRRITRDLMGESMGFTSAALTPEHERPGPVGWRAPGPGDRQGPPLRGRHHRARRADDGPVAEGDREAPRTSSRASGPRASRRSSSTTTSSTCTRSPTGS